MPLKIKCPSCKHVLSVPVQRVGRTVRCPICETKLRVPKPRQTQGDKPDQKADATKDKRPRATPQAPQHRTRPSSEQQPQREHSPPAAKRTRSRPNIPPPKKDAPAKPDSPKRSTAATDVVEPKEPQERPQPTPPKPPPLPKSRRKEGPATKEPRPDESSKTSSGEKDKDRKPEQIEAKTSPERDDIGTEAQPQDQDKTVSGSKKQGSPLKPPRPPSLRTKRAAKDEPSAASPTPPKGEDEHKESMPPNRRETPPTEPESPEEEDNNVRGFEHDSRKRWAVYQFGIGLILATLFGAVPAAMDIIDHFRTVDSPGVSRWAYGLLLVSGVQLAYALYLIQLPDWSTVRVVSVVTLVLATAYAMLLAITMLLTEESPIIQFLGLSDKMYPNKAAGWCVILLGISSLLAYLGGRISMRWRQAYELLTEPMAAE